MKPLPRPLRFRRFSAVQLLIALVAFFICAPFVEEIKGGDLIVSGLFSLVLVAGVVAVAQRKRTLMIAIVLAFLAIAGRWINHFRPDLIPPVVLIAGGVILLAFAVGRLLPSSFCPAWVTSAVICVS